MDAAKDDRLEALYVLALTTGMRKGELLGLRWEDVEMERLQLSIVYSLQHVGHGRYELREPKTKRSRRRVPLSKVGQQALSRHRSRQEAEREVAADVWQDRGLVFTNIVGGALSPHNVLRRSFYSLLERAGLPRVRFHDLRHTAATLLLFNGTHPKIVSEMLGHTQISITLDLYSHVTENMLGTVATTFDELFGCQIGCQSDEVGNEGGGLDAL